MSWFRSDKPGSPDARVEAIRSARKTQGHDLTALQEGIIRSIAAWEPAVEAASRQAFDAVEGTVAATGRWEDEHEWRIGTWVHSAIVRSPADGPGFTVTVRCDGQTLSCGCPSFGRAYGFMRLYQTLIVDQFYSIGPPWADQSLFMPKPG